MAECARVTAEWKKVKFLSILDISQFNHATFKINIRCYTHQIVWGSNLKTINTCTGKSPSISHHYLSRNLTLTFNLDATWCLKLWDTVSATKFFIRRGAVSCTIIVLRVVIIYISTSCIYGNAISSNWLCIVIALSLMIGTTKQPPKWPPFIFWRVE